MWKLLVVALMGLEFCSCLDIDCTTFKAINNTIKTLEEGQHYFKIDVKSSDWTPGKAVYLSLGSKVIDTFKVKFNSFLLQAHTASDEPIGTWEILNVTTHKKHTCKSADDTLINNGKIQGITEVVAKWYPPTSTLIDIPLGEVDFNAAVIGEHQHTTYTWNNIRSEVLEKKVKDVHDIDSETSEREINPETQEKEATETTEETRTGTGENPGEGEIIEEEQRKRSEQLDQEGTDHDAKVRESYEEETAAMLKEKERREKEKQDEDNESEGPWVAEEARKKDEEEEGYEHELQMYEKEQAEEEEKRHQMMLLEIKDKEEHDKLMAEMSTTMKTMDKDQNEVNDDTEEIDDLGKKVNGVSRTVISFTTLLLAFVITLL